MQVSVREFKNHLSKYLHKISEGESIIVTSHNVALARLLPISQSTDKNVRQILQLEGVSWNGKKPKGGRKRPQIKGKTVAEYVIEDRR